MRLRFAVVVATLLLLLAVPAAAADTGSTTVPTVPPTLADGRVAGVVFARSVSDGSVDYALQASEVVHELQAANAQSSAVGTGRCAAD